MKTSALILLAGLFLIGCAPKAKITRFSETTRQATVGEMEVFDALAGNPARPFVQLGRIEIDDRHTQPVRAIIEAARKMGADGVILTGQRDGQRFGAPVGGIMIHRTFTFSTAIAFKYK